MLKDFLKAGTTTLSAVLLFVGMQLEVQATGLSSVLPNAGINVALTQSATIESLQDGNKDKSVSLEIMLGSLETEKQAVMSKEVVVEESFEHLVIAQTREYLNVRSTPDQRGTVVGKFYDDAAGVILSEQNGWYEIQSGNVTGFVKAQYCVVGEEAAALVEEVGTRMARVVCDRLLVRQEASMDGTVLGMVAMGDELVVLVVVKPFCNTLT